MRESEREREKERERERGRELLKMLVLSVFQAQMNHSSFLPFCPRQAG